MSKLCTSDHNKVGLMSLGIYKTLSDIMSIKHTKAHSHTKIHVAVKHSHMSNNKRWMKIPEMGKT